MSKNILLITYYWPPAGGPGVQRWLGFIKDLHYHNYNVTVVIPENPDYPSLDRNLETNLPDTIAVLKVPIKEPSRWSSTLSRKHTKKLQRGLISSKKGSIEQALLWLRGNLFIPDARVFWVKPVVKMVLNHLQSNSYQNIISTGPPHSVHLAALKIKKQTGIKWLADFRDPWTNIGYHKELKLTARAAATHKKLELLVLNTADAIVTTSHQTTAAFKELTSVPVHTVTNGFSVKVNSQKNQPDSDYYNITHVGTLLNDRNPQALWAACANLCNEVTDFRNKLRINLAGNISDEVINTVKEYGLENNLNLLGYLPHADAVTAMQQAQLLLLIEINHADTRCILPGKMYEYFASKRPILAIGPEGGEMAFHLDYTKAGIYAHYDNAALIKSSILDHFKKYETGSNTAIASTNIEQYHRTYLTTQLAQILDLWA